MSALKQNGKQKRKWIYKEKPVTRCPHCKSRISKDAKTRLINKATALRKVSAEEPKSVLPKCETDAREMGVEAGKLFRIRHLLANHPEREESAVLVRWLGDIVGELTQGR